MSTTTDTPPQDAQDAAQEPLETSPAAEDQDDPTGPENAAQEPETDEPTDKAGREAAKYRRQLRETEAERDTLAARISELERGAVADAIVRDHRVAKPDVILEHVDVSSLFTDGRIDAEKLREAVDAAVDAYGLARVPRPPKPNPAQGASASGVPPTGDAWTLAFEKK